MLIPSISTYIRTNRDQNFLYDLFNPYIMYRPDIEMNDYEVKDWQEMRIDLIYQDMYSLDTTETLGNLGNIDILLVINNIDNPFNIKAGMILKYPKISDYGLFRYKEDEISVTKRSAKESLVVPNLKTKKDKSRENYKKSGYSLPPVVLDTPKPSVRYEEGKIKLGGL